LLQQGKRYWFTMGRGAKITSPWPRALVFGALLSIILITTAYISFGSTGLNASVTATLQNPNTQCATTFKNGAQPNSVVYLKPDSPVEICLKYYYYNTTGTMRYSPLSDSPPGGLEIIGTESVAGSNTSRPYDANSQFSISASTGQVQIGGNSNLNEGISETYTISMQSSTASGVYFIGIGAVLYPELETCGTYLELVVGNAQYSPGGGMCVYYPHPHGLNEYGFVNGVPFVEIVGITDVVPNS
jgi:hypothetical protein